MSDRKTAVSKSKTKSKVKKRLGQTATPSSEPKSKLPSSSESQRKLSTGQIPPIKPKHRQKNSIELSAEKNSSDKSSAENAETRSHNSSGSSRITGPGGSAESSGGEKTASNSPEEESVIHSEENENEEEFVELHRVSQILAKKLERFEMSTAGQVPEQPSLVADLRGYHSEPCMTIPFHQKFTLKKSQTKLQNGMHEIKEKYMSMEDLSLVKSDYPELVTGALSDAKFRSYSIDETMISSWNSIFQLEKSRFSFFDELFAQGFVVDSMEVPRSGHQEETEDYFLEAEPKDFRDKIDYGRVVFKTKHVYTGNFVDWYFQGPGKYLWVDGTIYQGEFWQGLMHGKGTIHWPDGCNYEGEFANGTRAGWGVYSTEEGVTYSGDWSNGLPHGHGKMWYDPNVDDGDYYDGNWAEGFQSGPGTRQYSNGDRYIGNWSQGGRNGIGSIIWLTEKQVYKGEWVNGVPHGKGKHIWYLERSSSSAFPSRNIYCGDWHEGKRHGIGKMIYPCGSIYEGRWNNGQRHGKGVFLNPAGGVMMGIFRGGAVISGSEMPLHVPSYEYDFGGLVEWLTVKFSLKIEDELMEEENLTDTTTRFLTHLRNLYKRAGTLGYSWCNNGLYPYWMKKSHPLHDHNIPNHNESDDPPHMKGNETKPPAPDGIHPVTRFGLWLLIKDCAGLTDDATLAYFDRHFSDTPSISFQTRHNPFEPIYLWQFLQCLVIVAVAVNMEIPEQKSHWISEDGDEPPASSNPSTENIPSTPPKDVPEVVEIQENIIATPGEASLPTSPVEEEDSIALPLNPQISGEFNHSNEESTKGSTEMLQKAESIEEMLEVVKLKSKEIIEEHVAHHERPRVFKLSISEAFEALLMDKLVPCLDREAGINLPPAPSPLPPLTDMYDKFKDIKGRDWITAAEFMQNSLPHKVYPNSENVLFWHRCPEVLSTNVNLEEMFELQKKIQSNSNEEDDAYDDGSISLGSGYLGSTTKIASKPVENGQQNVEKSDGIEELMLQKKLSVADYVTDPTPFGVEDLTSEPFLWNEESKCRHVERDPKYYKNLTTRDILNTLRHLYPNLVGHADETNVEFDMIFCDWLWAVSLNAKASTDREFRSGMKSENEDGDGHNVNKVHINHRHRKAPHGVFANHVKRIRNNGLVVPNTHPKSPSARMQSKSLTGSVVSSTSTKNSPLSPANNGPGRLL